MKKLLLTLLGAAALCGLSPHPASAQDHSLISRTYTTATAKFTDGLVSMGKRVNGAMEGATNTADYTLSNSELQTPTTMPTGQAAHGWGQFQVKSTTTDDEPLIVDFDFTNCSTTPKNDNPAWYQNTAYINTSIYAYTGAKIKLSFNGKKRIKAIQLQTNIYGNNISKAFTDYKKNIKCIKDFNTDTEDDRFTLNSVSIDNTGITVKYESSLLYGDDPSLTLDFINASKYYYLQIRQIIITFYDNSDGWIPAKDTNLTYGMNYATPIYYQNGESIDTWTEATGSQLIELDESVVKVKLGQAVTTYQAPTTRAAGQHTVIIDPIKRIVGTTPNVKFFTQLDTEFKKDDQTLYKVEYLHNNLPSNGYARHVNNLNTTLPSAAIIYSTSGSSKVYSSSPNILSGVLMADGLTPDNATYTVNASASIINDPWSANNANSNQKNGKQMCTGYDGIRLYFTHSTDAGEVQSPFGPQVTMPTTAVLNPTTEIYNIMADLDLPVTLANDIYPDAKIYYIISQEPVGNANFDKSKASAVEDGKVHIDQSCYIALRTYATVDGKDAFSGVLSYQFNRVSAVNITDPKQLLDKSKEKELVRLDFPLQILASGYMTSSPKELSIYTRDTLGTSVRLVTRLNESIVSMSSTGKESRLFPGAAFKGVSTQTIASWPFCPVGGVVGELQFDDQDRPVIVLKDEEHDIDNFQYCYAGASITPTDAMKQNSGTFVRNTFTGNRRDKLSADDYGKYAYVIATYNKTDKTFTPVGATEILSARTTTATGFLNCYPTSTYSAPTTSSLTNDVEYALTGIVEYDAEEQEYYIMPRAINPMPARPKVTTESLSGSTQVIDSQENEDGTAGSAIIKLVSKLKLNFTNATSGYYLYSYLNPSTNSLTTKGVQKATGNATFNLSSSSFDENKQIVFTVNIQNCNETSAPIYISDPYIFTVTDVVSTAPVYNSIAEVKKELKEKSSDDLKDKYFKVTGNMVVLGFDDTNKYMYLRDADSDGYLIAYSEKGWNYTDYRFVHCSFHDGTTTKSLYYNPRIGDQITEMTFTPKDESGVMIADVSGLEGKYDPGTNIYTVDYQ